MSMSRLAEFMSTAGSRPYRELIEHHIKKQSESELRLASVGEIQRLPDSYRQMGVTYIDAVNAAVGHDAHFWATATCEFAYQRFLEVAVNLFDLPLGEFSDDLWLEDEELGFTLFQIPTLSFAYSAHSQRAQRKFMGIRKGIFG